MPASPALDVAVEALVLAALALPAAAFCAAVALLAETAEAASDNAAVSFAVTAAD